MMLILAAVVVGAGTQRLASRVIGAMAGVALTDDGVLHQQHPRHR